MKLGLATVLTATAAVLAIPAGAAASVIDLANAPGTVRLDGQAEGDHAAGAVANVGDVNADGRPDFIVGAQNAGNRSRDDSGSAYVVYGGSGLAGVKRRILGANGFRIDGAVSGDHAGAGVGPAGDVNGDGIADVIVGAPGSDPGGMQQAGAAYVIHGQKTPDLANVDLAKLKSTQADRGMEIDGGAEFAVTGGSVSGGHDMNFDQVSDVIVGAPGLNVNGVANTGAAYEIWGQATADPPDVDLTKIENAQSDRGMEIDGTPQSFAGFPVTASRDVNDDGIADAVVGAIFTSPGGRQEAGTAYVVYGMNGDDPPDADLGQFTSTQAGRGMLIEGPSFLAAEGGIGLTAGRDLNGDGVGDILVGFRNASTKNRQDTGITYVIYGASGDANDVDTAQLTAGQAARGMRIVGSGGGEEAGAAVDAGGDVNGDGRPDAIIGAPDANHGHILNGSAYVIFGRHVADPEDIDLAKITKGQASRGLRIDGPARDDKVGTAVAASQGDLNADGRRDVIAGTPNVGNNGAESGSAWVVGLPR